MVAILRTEGLTRAFGRFQAVRGVDLQVEEGDLFGFLGLNGAGKTTTIRMCLRLIRPTSGRVELFGRDAERHFIENMTQVGALLPFQRKIRQGHICFLADFIQTQTGIEI